MEFKTSVKFTEQTFNRLQKRIKDFSEARRELALNPSFSTPIPHEVNLQLTYACNLRCKMCYQWNDEGFFHGYNKEIQQKELSIDIIKKVLSETRSIKSRMYLWGGEPLFHSKWNDIANELEQDLRHTIICTNGLLIEKNMDSLNKISSDLSLLVSVDGIDEVNDALRGKRTFEKIIRQLEIVKEEQQKGNFRGSISINAVLNDELIPQMIDFVEYFEALGVDSIYFNYPWFISKERALQMDSFYNENFSWLSSGVLTEKASWHSYTFKISSSSEQLLVEQIKKLKDRVWKVRVRFQQEIEMNDVGNFIDDSFQSNRKCLAFTNRIEIMADGKVGTCSKFFPEFTIGDLHQQSLIEIWRGEAFQGLRSVVARGLMPVCSKCVLLYRNGIS